MNRISALLLLPLLTLPLYACGKQETPAPRGNVAAPTSVSAEGIVPAPDNFYIKVDECSKKNRLPRKIEDSEATGLTGKWAVPISRDIIESKAREAGVKTEVFRNWGGNLGRSQSVDLNDDGLCDLVETLPYTLVRLAINPDNSFPQANGYALVMYLRVAEKSKDYLSSDDRESKHFDDSFEGFYANSIEVPGSDGDRAVVLKVYPKLGGMPYIVLPTRRGAGVVFPEPQFDANGLLTGMEPSEPQYDSDGWDIIRWDPEIKKFRNIFKRYDPIFSPDNAEYWSLLAWLAERYLEDGLKAFKAREFSTAETILSLAADTDPRNLDILTWRAHFAYASGRFEEAAGFYDSIIQRDKYATAKPPLEQTYFNLGLSREAQCWQQVRGRNPGDPQGCSDEIFRKAQVAYLTYLKLAPNGERAAEVKKRLEDMRKGSFRQPVGDAELAASGQWLDKLAKVFVQASRGAARPEPRPVSSAETGQPQHTRQADPYTLTPSDLKKIDQEIARLLQKKGLRFEQWRIDWMIAYKAKFPDADLNDLIVRPEYYEALPWVQAWRKTYSGLQK